MSASSLLSHRVDGEGEPLLLLNGGMMSYSAWDGYVPPLAERYRVIRCDLRGMLRSPGQRPEGFPGHAEDLLALLDHLGVAGDRDAVRAEALEWATTRGARSGRTAWQFIQDFQGRQLDARAEG